MGREAVQAVHRALCAGHTEVIDADVSSYFDTIPHADVMTSLARRLRESCTSRSMRRGERRVMDLPRACLDQIIRAP
jgi:retron-type reverse transcriptase